MKKATAFLISLIYILLSFSSFTALAAPTVAEPPDTSMARAACVFNVENKEECFVKGEDEILYPASTAKMMTALLALEYFTGKMKTQITITAEMLYSASSSGLSLGLIEGEVVTAEDMIYGVIVGGAGDAAYALAYTIAGGAAEFVDMMNSRAAELEMNDTFFSNPTGEHTDRMVTKIRDVVKLATAAYNINGFIDMSSTAEYDMPATNMRETYRAVRNRNSFISSYYDNRYRDGDVFGLNAGSTEKAGECVVAVENDGEGKTFITAVMDAKSDDKENYAYRIAENLMIWVNRAYSFTCVLEATRIITEFPVILSDKKDTVPLLPDKKIDALLPTGVDTASEITVEFTLDEKQFTAPVSAGMKAGTVSAYYEGRLLGTTDLVAKSNVSRSNIKYFFRKLLELFTKPLFYLVIIILFVAYRLYKQFTGKQKQKIAAEKRKKELQRKYSKELQSRAGRNRNQPPSDNNR